MTSPQTQDTPNSLLDSFGVGAIGGAVAGGAIGTMLGPVGTMGGALLGLVVGDKYEQISIEKSRNNKLSSERITNSEITSEPDQEQTTEDIDRVLIRITEDVGDIFCVDERSYNLSEGDVVVLPKLNAAPLIDRGVAEILEVNEYSPPEESPDQSDNQEHNRSESNENDSSTEESLNQSDDHEQNRSAPDEGSSSPEESQNQFDDQEHNRSESDENDSSTEKSLNQSDDQEQNRSISQGDDSVNPNFYTFVCSECRRSIEIDDAMLTTLIEGGCIICGAPVTEEQIVEMRKAK